MHYPPKVSVIIPAYNGEKYLSEALQSILDQDYPHYDIWVIDNGSTDHTQEIARSFPNIHIHRSEQASTPLARNLGILLSTAPYIAFLDQDDTWVPHKLSAQVAFLEAKKEYGAVIGHQHIYLQTGYEKPHWLKQIFLEAPQPGYLPSALMIRRSTLLQTHPFDANLPFCSDIAWFFKAKHMGISIGTLNEVLIHRRIHDDNTSNRCATLQKEILLIIKESLKARRHE